MCNRLMLNRLMGSLVIALAVQCASTPAMAGRTCAPERAPQLDTVVRGLELAERTLKALDASGAKVVVLARAGQDLSQYHLHYSHLGFAYRVQTPPSEVKGAAVARGEDKAKGESEATGQGDATGHVWRVLHKLNQCGSAQASVYRQGLGEFFLDDLWRYEAAWVVPTPEVQERLLALIQDPAKSVRMHHRPYSVVSYAWGRRYQQSNQWAIETLAMAMEPGVATREQAQGWLQFKGYRPTPLRIGALTRLGARIGTANVAFDDHPDNKRFSDRIETVTVDSVFAWLPRAGLGGEVVKIESPQGP